MAHETRHTPGPWTCDPDETDLFGEYRIRPAFDGDFRCDEDIHNARLIAAAPDLLDACRQALDFAEMWRERPLVRALRAAIERATTG